MKDDAEDIGMVVHRVTTCCSSQEVYKILWYSGGYESTVYESEITPTGFNRRDDVRKRRKKH